MAVIETEFYRTMRDELNPFIFNQLLFFNTWEDPDGFYELTRHQRHVVMKKLRPVSVSPTKANHWIWFGSYVGPAKTPQLNEKIIHRELYNHYIGNHGGGNIRGLLTKTRSDVNPNKYFPRLGFSQQQVMAEFLNRTGEQAEVPDSNEKVQRNFQKYAAKCMKEIRRTFTPGFCDTREEMQKYLLTQYPALVVQYCLDNTDIKFKIEHI